MILDSRTKGSLMFGVYSLLLFRLVLAILIQWNSSSLCNWPSSESHLNVELSKSIVCVLTPEINRDLKTVPPKDFKVTPMTCCSFLGPKCYWNCSRRICVTFLCAGSEIRIPIPGYSLTGFFEQTRSGKLEFVVSA